MAGVLSVKFYIIFASCNTILSEYILQNKKQSKVVVCT